MPSHPSRYRYLDEVVTVDADGRRVPSRALRPLEPVEGRHRHTVTQHDRLDQLAHAYYGQSRTWWRICDANPQVLSPQALLGQEPVVTHHFAVAPEPGEVPPWADLLRDLGRRVGVSRAVLAPEPPGGILVTFNRLDLTVGDVAEAIADAGLVASGTTRVGQVGREIVIPPDVFG